MVKCHNNPQLRCAPQITTINLFSIVFILYIVQCTIFILLTYTI